MSDRLTQFALIRQNLCRKSFRTFMLAAIVALFACTLFCGTFLGCKIGMGTKLLGERLGADALFVPYGYEGKMQQSLLRGEPTSFYLNGSLTEKIRAEEGVGKATSQLFIASLNASCCTLPVQLIGYEPKTDFVVKPWISKVLSRPLKSDEVVVGHKITGLEGDAITLFGREFTVAARLEPTGMGFDTSVFLDIDLARRLLLQSELAPRLNLPESVSKENFVSSTLVKFSPGANVRDTINAILQKYALEYNLDFVVVAGMITDISSRLGLLSGIFYGLSGALWLLALCVLGLVFSAMVQERKRELGLLRIIGASRGSLICIILKEALLISGGGALFGVGFACLILFPFNTYINAVLQLPSIDFGPIAAVTIAAAAFLLGLVIGPLACLPVSLKLGRNDVYLSFREE